MEAVSDMEGLLHVNYVRVGEARTCGNSRRGSHLRRFDISLEGRGSRAG